MIDREKVIKGLKAYVDCYDNRHSMCKSDCLLYSHGDCAKYVIKYINEAISLLKEQEPRVMTLDEAAADHEVWTEAKLRGTERIPLFISILWLTDDVKDFELELMGTSKRAFMLSKEYGKTWRCWSAKPTDEQRLAVKWNDKTDL